MQYFDIGSDLIPPIPIYFHFHTYKNIYTLAAERRAHSHVYLLSSFM